MIGLFRSKSAPKQTPPEKIRRIVTDGFANSTMGNAETFFVEAEKQGDGQYMLYATNNYTTDGQLGFRRQVLTEHHTLVEVLNTMNEWERLNRTQFDISGRPTGREAPHYTEVAERMGIAVGPEMTSQQHTRRIKLVIAARRRGAGAGL